MGNKITYLMSFVLFLLLASCVTSRSLPSATITGLRTIVLNGDTISEKDVGGFRSWYCKDYINGGQVLVEVGFLGDPTFKGFGFILYDGGYSGEFTNYHRNGLEHRWDWEPNETDYTFSIKPDGSGFYYDFTTVSDGESTKPRALYKCYQR